jgi:hypothetical protein
VPCGTRSKALGGGHGQPKRASSLAGAALPAAGLDVVASNRLGQRLRQPRQHERQVTAPLDPLEVMIMQKLSGALALGCSILIGATIAPCGSASAQAPSGPNQEDIKKQDSVPPATAPKLTEQSGKTEPSAKVEGTHPNSVFVNGVLDVPGASTDLDTAPAKHWARTNADDQIPIAGYRLKKLDPQQLRQIAQELTSQREAPAASPASGNYAVIGAEVPANVALAALNPVPQTLTDKFVELRGTAFMRSAGKLVIVDPKNNVVLGVLEG